MSKEVGTVVVVETVEAPVAKQAVMAGVSADGGVKMQHTQESAIARLNVVRDEFFAKLKEYSSILATGTTIGTGSKAGKGKEMPVLLRMFHGAIMVTILNSRYQRATTLQVVNFIVGKKLLPENIMKEIVDWPGDGNPCEKVMRAYERTFNDREGVWSSAYVDKTTHALNVNWRFDKQNKNLSKPVFKEIAVLMATAYPPQKSTKIAATKGTKKAVTAKAAKVVVEDESEVS